MKNIKKITLGILGTAVLASGLWACSDDNESSKQISNEKQVNSKLNSASKEIYDIVDVFSITIDKKINNPELSDNELGEIFLNEVKERGVKVQDVSDLKNINLSEEFANYSNKIKHSDFDNYNNYIDYLYNLNKEIDNNDFLTSEEKNILGTQVSFSLSFLDMLNIKNSEMNFNEKSTITTYGN